MAGVLIDYLRLLCVVIAAEPGTGTVIDVGKREGIDAEALLGSLGVTLEMFREHVAAVEHGLAMRIVRKSAESN